MIIRRATTLALTLLLAMSLASAGPVEDALTNPQLLAKAASRLSVFANVCSAYFFVDVEDVRKSQEIAMKQGRLNSQNFETLLKQEIQRRFKEVQEAGEWDWCVASRKDYEQRGIYIFGQPPKPPIEPAVKMTPNHIALMLASIAIGSKACGWKDAPELMQFAMRKHAVSQKDYSPPRGRFLQLVDNATDMVIKHINKNGPKVGCKNLADLLHGYIPDYERSP
jgi:hypothetical protein